MITFFITSVLLGAGLAMDAFSVSVANAMRDPNMKKGEMARIAGAFAFFQFLMPEIGFLCVHTLLTYFESFQVCIPWIALVLLTYIGGKMLLEGFRDRRDMHGTDGRMTDASKICRKEHKEKEEFIGKEEHLEKEAECPGAETADVRGGVASFPNHGKGFSDKEAFDSSAEKSGRNVQSGKSKGVKALPTHTLILQAIATSIDALSVGFAIAEYTVTEALIAGVIIATVTFCICIGGLLIGKKTGDLLGWRASIFGGVILIGIGIEIWVTGIF